MSIKNGYIPRKELIMSKISLKKKLEIRRDYKKLVNYILTYDYSRHGGIVLFDDYGSKLQGLHVDPHTLDSSIYWGGLKEVVSKVRRKNPKIYFSYNPGGTWRLMQPHIEVKIDF